MIAAAANLSWLTWNAGARQKFIRQLHSPQDTQHSIFTRLLSQHANSAFGRAYDFTSIRSEAEYRQRVPIAKYEIVEPWIKRIRCGESNVLSVDHVTHLVPTSGSSGARKLIPFTAGLQRGFNAAINPWVSDIFHGCRAALLGPAYWSISPAITDDETEPSALPIGFDDDTSYLGGVSRRMIDATMAVPSCLRLIADFEQFSLLTLLCLLRRSDLRLISVWHPSFLALLLDRLPSAWPQLLDILRHGRLPAGWKISAAIRSALRLSPDPRRARELSSQSPDDYARLWPKLQLISCWADANAAAGAANLQKRFPNVTIQPKGLLATEAFVTLPFAGKHPLAIGSHYFEFIDETGACLPLEALQIGQYCEVVVTTGGGLWRYRLGDRVLVDGRIGKTPSFRFVGRAGQQSDLRGEKLSDDFVAGVLHSLLGGHTTPSFAMLAPNDDLLEPGYTLFIDKTVPPPKLAEQLDLKLSANPHYALCRRLGQLSSVRVQQISSRAEEIYFDFQRRRGHRVGEIKIPSLDIDRGWQARFSGTNQASGESA
jgi:GH3 auxin-responsive promoter